MLNRKRSKMCIRREIAEHAGSASRVLNTPACRSVGSGVHTVSGESQLDTCCQAMVIVRGLRNALGLVAIRRNASKLAHDSPTGAEPLSFPSSQSRLSVC